MIKYRIILIVMALLMTVLFSFANFKAYYTIETYYLFVIFELAMISIVLIIVFIALRLDIYIYNAGFRKMTEEQILTIKDEKTSEFIHSILRKEKFNENQ